MYKAPFKIILENFHLSFAINSEYVHSIIFLFSEYISKSIYETDTCSGFQKAYEFEYETGTLKSETATIYRYSKLIFDLPIWHSRFR